MGEAGAATAGARVATETAPAETAAAETAAAGTERSKARRERLTEAESEDDHAASMVSRLCELGPGLAPMASVCREAPCASASAQAPAKRRPGSVPNTWRL